MRIQKAVLWLNEVGKDDIASVGGKGASLGHLINAGIPVPPGFVVTAETYYDFLQQAGLTDTLRSGLAGLDTNDSKALSAASDQIKRAITSAAMPQAIARAISEAYHQLGEGLVAVRSSATAEDLPEASFAGQQATFLNITGAKNVVRSVQACWASLFEARAIFYRQEQGFDHLAVGIAVPVQRMVQSERAGVMFTVDPLTSDNTRLAIEAIFGLGEAIVSGSVTPDLYLVDKASLKLVETKIARQEWMLTRNTDHFQDPEDANLRVDVPSADQQRQKLSDEQIMRLARMGREIEDLYGSPQDIEWATEGDEVYIVQSRPITTLREIPPELKKIAAKVLISGSGASPGMASGPVKIVPDVHHLDMVEQGDVLVTEMTTPDFVPAMKRASAIVTDHGGRTCHAAIVSRELGISCVVGTGNATRLLRQGQVVTVDGVQGKVYEGRIEVKGPEATGERRRIKTTTRVYVNLADPELADAIAQRHVDGVGLLRAEFIVAHIGQHPRYMLDRGRGQAWAAQLAQGIETFAHAFHPRPVVYRTTDFKTNEYRNLEGGERYEDQEENPMIGYRGASRYLREPDLFKLEAQAIRTVRERYDNLVVMLPFVRTPEELQGAKRALEREGLRQGQGLKLWMMVEIPSNVILLEQFIAQGIDGVSIGSNDLTQLTLGVDRDNAKFAELFDERNPAVLWCLERVIKTAREHGITCSICGQAPSVWPDLTEKLVEWGITSVSVSPDMIDRTRDIVARVERKQGKLPRQEQ